MTLVRTLSMQADLNVTETTITSSTLNIIVADLDQDQEALQAGHFRVAHHLVGVGLSQWDLDDHNNLVTAEIDKDDIDREVSTIIEAANRTIDDQVDTLTTGATIP